MPKFVPTTSPSADTPPPERDLPVPMLREPLRLVMTTDRAMEPELSPGQQVFVEDFDVHGANYLEQRFAVKLRGRVLIRFMQHMGGEIRLWGRQDGYEERLIPPEGWEKPDGWRSSGILHPDLVALGPVVTTRKGGHQYIATLEWGN